MRGPRGRSDPRRSLNRVAPVIARPRKRAGRVKTAQRRRAVLTRPSDSEQSSTGATRSRGQCPPTTRERAAPEPVNLPQLRLSEKHVIFSDKKAPKLATQTVDSQVLRRIKGRGRGSVFTPADFVDLAGRAAVDQTLSRLAKASTLRRLARGVYHYPQQHRSLGELRPSAEVIAKALAGRDRTRLQPSGVYAANLLGLSEQVPMKVVFLTDGPSRLGTGRPDDDPTSADDTAQHGSRRAPQRSRDPGFQASGQRAHHARAGRASQTNAAGAETARARR